MTDAELQEIEEWAKDTRASNAYMSRDGLLSGSELAVEHVDVLLAEVRRLQKEVAELTDLAGYPPKDYQPNPSAAE